MHVNLVLASLPFFIVRLMKLALVENGRTWKHCHVQTPAVGSTRWKWFGSFNSAQVELEATAEDPGTTLRAPTAEAGLAPACKDTCFGVLKLQIWEKRYDGSKGKVGLLSPLVRHYFKCLWIYICSHPSKSSASFLLLSNMMYLAKKKKG